VIRTASLGISEARAIALAAQGFDRARGEKEPAEATLRETIDRLGAVQLDSVNVFCRSHYLPIFSRIGYYDRELLDGIAGHGEEHADRQLFEYWGHEASLLPPDVYRLLQWRNHRADIEAWKFVVDFAQAHPDRLEQALALVSEHGAITARATGQARDPAREGEMWNWHDGKLALEYLFYAGQVAVARRINFERLYDLPERVLPLAAREPVAPEADAQRGLIRIAGAALGVATEPDLGDYFRLTRRDSKTRVGELVELGELIPVQVEGWSTLAYLWPAAQDLTYIGGRALISPFDSLIWTRARTQRLFDFDYHLEIYTPAAKRQYGYYVLPFLLGDRLVARVDLKSDRKARHLLVQGAFAEADTEVETIARELAVELTDAARWLQLDDVQVVSHGNLADPLARALV
jgi:uncharacterized protein YcaQ